MYGMRADRGRHRLFQALITKPRCAGVEIPGNLLVKKCPEFFRLNLR